MPGLLLSQQVTSCLNSQSSYNKCSVITWILYTKVSQKKTMEETEVIVSLLWSSYSGNESVNESNNNFLEKIGCDRNGSNSRDLLKWFLCKGQKNPRGKTHPWSPVCHPSPALCRFYIIESSLKNETSVKALCCSFTLTWCSEYIGHNWSFSFLHVLNCDVRFGIMWWAPAVRLDMAHGFMLLCCTWLC